MEAIFMFIPTFMKIEHVAWDKHAFEILEKLTSSPLRWFDKII